MDATSNDWMEEEEFMEADFQSMRRNLITNGYRDGISEGQEYILQDSFNDGYAKAQQYYEKIAQYRGILSAILLYFISRGKNSKEITKKIEQSITELEKLEAENIPFEQDNLNDKLKRNRDGDNRDLLSEKDSNTMNQDDDYIDEISEGLSNMGDTTNTFNTVKQHKDDASNFPITENQSNIKIDVDTSVNSHETKEEINIRHKIEAVMKDTFDYLLLNVNEESVEFKLKQMSVL